MTAIATFVVALICIANGFVSIRTKKISYVGANSKQLTTPSALEEQARVIGVCEVVAGCIFLIALISSYFSKENVLLCIPGLVLLWSSILVTGLVIRNVQ